MPIPGRLERIADDPPTFVDAAHNPDGAAALAEALPALRRPPRHRLPGDPRRQGRRGDDPGPGPGPRRDAVCTELPADGPQAAQRGRLGPPALGSGGQSWRRSARRPGWRRRREPDFAAALRRASALAAEPPEGILLVAGSHYGSRSRRPGAAAPRRLSAGTARLCEDSGMDRGAGSQLLSMMGLVAAVVAIVILVFFGVGYLFGSLFL